MRIKRDFPQYPPVLSHLEGSRIEHSEYLGEAIAETLIDAWRRLGGLGNAMLGIVPGKRERALARSGGC